MDWFTIFERLLLDEGRIAGVGARFFVGGAALETRPVGVDDGLANTAALLAAKGEGSSVTLWGSAITGSPTPSFVLLDTSSVTLIVDALRWATRFWGAGFDAGVDEISLARFESLEGGRMTGRSFESCG